MAFALLALVLAAIGAGWLLMRAARSDLAPGESRTVAVLKAVIWLGLVAVLMAARIWPLAFMVLLAAVAVTAIEQWRARAIRDEESRNPVTPTNAKAMTAEEAASILGIEPEASAEEIRAAHRKLIGQIHPDKGGTDYLASKINEARDFLLKRFN